MFQSYGLKRKHVANEGQHGEGHEGCDQDQERKEEKMSEAGKGEAGGEKMTKQGERRREKQRQESWNQGCTFVKPFFEYLPVLFSGSGAGEETESFFCAVQEMGRLGT